MAEGKSLGEEVSYMARALVPLRSRVMWPFRRMEEEMEGLMGRLFTPEEEWPLTEWPTEGFVPAMSVAETEKTYEITLEVPGLKPEELSVEMKHGELYVSGEKKEEKEEKGKTFHRVERRYGAFRRVIPLPEAVGEKEVQAEFHEGVLKITLPKKEPTHPTKIEVKT